MHNAFSHSSIMESQNTNAYNHQLGVPLSLMMTLEHILEVGEEIGDIVRMVVILRLVRKISLNLSLVFTPQVLKLFEKVGNCLKDDVLPETLSSLKIVLPGQKSSLTLDPLKQMVIITP